MVLNIGDIIEGTVEKITNYGAFISLPDGKKGLVHISEVAPSFVEDINVFLKEKDKVRVKVIAINPDGNKISLSIKQAHGLAEEKAPRFREEDKPILNRNDGPTNKEFEEKLAKFLKSSNEKLSALKQNTECKRGGSKHRKKV